MVKYVEGEDPEILKANHEYIETRWQQLSKFTLDQSKDGINFLFLSNAGAAVAILTFLGTAQFAVSIIWPWLSLGLFFSGVVFIAFFHAANYTLLSKLLEAWKLDVAQYYQGETDFDDVVANDAKRSDSKSWRVPVGFAYISMGCFIAGGTIGLFKYQDFIRKGNSDVRQEATANTAADAYKTIHTITSSTFQDPNEGQRQSRTERELRSEYTGPQATCTQIINQSPPAAPAKSHKQAQPKQSCSSSGESDAKDPALP
jgi:hypothetical protein